MMPRHLHQVVVSLLLGFTVVGGANGALAQGQLTPEDAGAALTQYWSSRSSETRPPFKVLWKYDDTRTRWAADRQSLTIFAKVAVLNTRDPSGGSSSLGTQALTVMFDPVSKTVRVVEGRDERSPATWAEVRKEFPDDEIFGGVGSPPPPAGFSVAAGLDNWEESRAKEDSIVLKRKTAKIKAPCGWDASVDASITAKFTGAVQKPKDAGEALALAEASFKARRQGATPSDMAVGLALVGGKEGASSFAMGEFTGAIADFALWLRGGSWSAGYTGEWFGSNGAGHVIRNGEVIEFSYGVSGRGCWDNSSRSYLVTQGVAAQEEARAILASLRWDGKKQTITLPYTGPKYDGSDLPKVVLNPDTLAKLSVGDTVTVQAVVENARPEDSPFKYNWGGTFDAKPQEVQKSATVTIRPAKPGKYDLSVSVDGARFGLGSASLKYEVADFKVKVERVPAATGPVYLGVKTGFNAVLTSDGKPAAGAFVYRWQPHPEATFDKLDANDPSVSAVFPRPGRVKVWVQVLAHREGRLVTLVESAQMEIEVLKPQLRMSIQPNRPFVGEEIEARLAVTPEVKEIDFRWLPLTGPAKQLSESKDGRAITFYATDVKGPVTVEVLARVPVSGDDLGKAKESVTATLYGVNILGPRFYGPPVMIWKGGGLVPLPPPGIAVHQIVEFSTSIQPAPKTGPVRHDWAVTQGPCRVSNPLYAEARLTGSDVGTCTLSVTIRDKNDVVLGGDTKPMIQITVSEATLKDSENKAKAAEEAKKKIPEARAAWERGEVDRAVTILEEARRLDPENRDAQALHADYQGRKTRIDGQMAQAREKARLGKLDEAIASAREALKENPRNAEVNRYIQQVEAVKDQVGRELARVQELIREREFQEAQRVLTPLKNAYAYHPPVQEMDRRLGEEWRAWDSRVNAALGEVRLTYERRDFKEALHLIEKTRRDMKLLPSHLKTLADAERYCRELEARKEKARGLFNAAEAKLRAYDYDGALADLKEGFHVSSDLWNLYTDPTPRHAEKLRSEALAKNKRINDLMPSIANVARDPNARTDLIETTLKNAAEVLSLQPNNAEATRYRAILDARLKERRSKAAASPPIKEGSEHPSATASDVLGTYAIIANGYRGTLEVSGGPGGYTGRVRFDYYGRWEALTEVSYSAAARSLSFTRPRPGGLEGYAQRHTGQFDGRRVAGTFSQQGASTIYQWQATRLGAGSSPDPPPRPGTASLPQPQPEAGWIEDKYYPVDLSPAGGKKSTPRRVKQVPMDDGSGIRLKSTDEKRLTVHVPLPAPQLAQTLAVVSHLDDATYLGQGVTIARMTVLTTTGEESFALQAGVHGSNWDYGVGPKHNRVADAEVGGGRTMHFFGLSRPRTITAIRFDYVETNAPKWVGHAPGYILGGITLIRFPRP